jgi:DNA-binding transcriptional LysR family regulator
MVRLEAALGQKLLERTTRTIQISASGQALLEYSKKIFECSSEAGQRLAAMKSGETGRIRITAPVSLGKWIFPDLAKFVRKNMPGIELDTDASNEPIDFQTDSVDFALRGTEVDDPDLIARPLGKLRDVIVCTPKIAAKISAQASEKEGAHPRLLEKTECILSSLSASWNVWTLVCQTPKREELRIKVSGKIMANEYATAIELTLEGLGVARLPYHAVEAHLLKGRLVQLFPRYAIGTHPLYLVYRKGSYHPRYHREIRDWLLKWFSEREKAFLKQ